MIKFQKFCFDKIFYQDPNPDLAKLLILFLLLALATKVNNLFFKEYTTYI